MSPSRSAEPSQRQRHPWLVPAVLGVVSLAGSALIWYGTYWGPWAFSDGVGYIVNARNLVLGRGLGLYRASGDFILLVTHPPLYPWLLAGLGKLGMDLIEAARWIDIVLFGGFLFAGGWGFWRVTRSAWLALGLTAVLLIHPALLLAYLSAMSEPLFLLCITIGLLMFANYLVNQKHSRFVLSAVAASGALLTRYPGAAVILACVAALWLLAKGGVRDKVRSSALFLSISVTPTLAFILWTRFVLNARNPRGFKSSYDLAALVTNFTRRALDAFWTWKPVPPDVIPDQILPTTLTHLMAGILAVLLAGGLIWSVVAAIRTRRGMVPEARPQLEWRPAGLFALFLISYVGFFFAVYMLSYPTPDVDSRTLLPLLPGGVFLAFALADILQRSVPRARMFNGLIAVAVVVGFFGWTVISQDIVIGLHRTGLGYTSRAWRHSETMQAVEKLPRDLTLVSNETAAILLYTDRSAYEIPGLKADDPNPISVPFGSGGSTLDQTYRTGQAALILFDTVKAQLSSGSEAARNLTPSDLTSGLTPIFEGSDGTIYCHCSLGAPAEGPDQQK